MSRLRKASLWRVTRQGYQCSSSKESWSDHRRVSTEADSPAQGVRIQAKQEHPCRGSWALGSRAGTQWMGLCTKGQPGLQGPSPREVKKAPTWGRWWQWPNVCCQSINGVMKVCTQEDGPVLESRRGEEGIFAERQRCQVQEFKRYENLMRNRKFT